MPSNTVAKQSGKRCKAPQTSFFFFSLARHSILPQLTRDHPRAIAPFRARLTYEMRCHQWHACAPSESQPRTRGGGTELGREPKGQEGRKKKNRCQFHHVALISLYVETAFSKRKGRLNFQRGASFSNWNWNLAIWQGSRIGHVGVCGGWGVVCECRCV